MSGTRRGRVSSARCRLRSHRTEVRFAPAPFRATHAAERLTRPRALRCRVDGVERLARGHEQAVGLGGAQTDGAADFPPTGAAAQISVPRPDPGTPVAR